MVIGCRSRQDRVIGQMRGQLLTILIDHNVENTFGLGLDGEDAFNGVEGISAESGGPLQGGLPVGTSIGGQQRVL